jgi:hypothetical protein
MAVYQNGNWIPKQFAEHRVRSASASAPQEPVKVKKKVEYKNLELKPFRFPYLPDSVEKMNVIGGQTWGETFSKLLRVRINMYVAIMFTIGLSSLSFYLYIIGWTFFSVIVAVFAGFSGYAIFEYWEKYNEVYAPRKAIRPSTKIPT